MHQSRICDTIVIDIYEYVDVYDNLIYVTEAKGLGIILVILQTVCYTGVVAAVLGFCNSHPKAKSLTELGKAGDHLN